MPMLPDARNERFAQLVAHKHISNAKAYRRAVDKPEMKPELAASMADKWLKWVDISGRIDELRTQAEQAISSPPSHALTFIEDGNVRRAVDYRNLGSEEFGSFYESLLELHPIINADAGTFEL